MNHVVLSRGTFIKNMATGVFKEYAVVMTDNGTTLVAKNGAGMGFALGNAAGDLRYFANIMQPTLLLSKNNVCRFTVEIEAVAA